MFILIEISHNLFLIYNTYKHFLYVHNKDILMFPQVNKLVYFKK